jgi:anti-sigma factor RsiW
VTTLPPDEHRILRDQLGVYVLGQSSPAEQEVLRAHLDGCALCRNDVAQLAPVAARLSGLNPTDLQALPAPQKQLRDKVLSQIADEEERDRLVHLNRRPRGLGIAAAAAGAAAAVAAAFVLGWQLRPVPPPVPLEAVAVEVTVTEIEATAGVVPHTWGMEVKLSGTGFAPGEVYRVTVADEDGGAVPAGQFLGVGSVEMNCNLNSSVLRDDAAGFEVVDAAGTVVLRSDL